jgi:hypothetical protein
LIQEAPLISDSNQNSSTLSSNEFTTAINSAPLALDGSSNEPTSMVKLFSKGLEMNNDNGKISVNKVTKPGQVTIYLIDSSKNVLRQTYKIVSRKRAK